jgi:hypothetical protein
MPFEEPLDQVTQLLSSSLLVAVTCWILAKNGRAQDASRIAARFLWR